MARYRFWYFVALCVLVARDPSGRVTDEDYAWYQDFMARHGFPVGRQG